MGRGREEMIGFLGIGLAPVVMSSEQEARHRLSVVMSTKSDSTCSHIERDRQKEGMVGWRGRIGRLCCRCWS